MLNVLLSALLLFAITLPIYAEQIVVAGDNWCPINCRADSNEQGFMIDVARQALAISGYELVYKEMPWARALIMARSGEIDAVVGAFRGDAADFIFSEQALLHISPNHLFALKDNQWLFQGISSLQHIRLGTIIDYDYGEALNNYINATTDKHVVKQLSGDDAVRRNILFLLRKRVDVVVEAAPVFWYHARSLGVTESVQQVGEVSPPEPCYIAFSPAIARSPAVAAALDAGLIYLKQHNMLEPIAQRYGLSAGHYTDKTLP